MYEAREIVFYHLIIQMIFTLNLLTNIQHKPKVVNQNTHITCSLEQLFHERALDVGLLQPCHIQQARVE